mmetsp:Transcript_4243/g.13276  ORF Transcript_4243/g.13276 Transcript_4243/m.13276 type:complete len:504 (-) Transcript_4243:327-1838(-)
MAPIELSVRIGSSAPFPVEIDDEETVEVLANVVMSMNTEIQDPPRLVHKGKVLKDEQELRSAGLAAGDMVVVAAGRRPAQTPVPSAATPAAPDPAATLAAAAADAPPVTPAASPGAEPPEGLVAELCAMGFERPRVMAALRAAFNDGDRAAEYLFNGIPETVGAADSGTAAPGAWPEGMLGPQLLTKTGPQPTRQALGGAAVVALYFSAHWCPPCRQFTPRLAAALAQPVPQLAVVFVSSDRDEASFQQYFSEMPWLALPFGSPQQQTLGPAFNVRGIPTLVVLDAATGRLISTDGRGDLTRGGFDVATCLHAWGVPAAPATPAAPSAPSAPAPAAPRAAAGPPPLAIDDAAADAALARVAVEAWEVQEVFFKTGLKVLDNVLQNPDEPKFRQLKRSNAALQSKLFGVAGGAGLELLDLAGFATSGEDGLCLGGPPDGRCTAVRQKMQAAATAAWERDARARRDARIQEELEKDKERRPRYNGGDGERMQVGRGRGPARGGGG